MGLRMFSIQSHTPRIVLNIQNHQLLNRIKFLKHLKATCDLASEGKVVSPFRETGPELITLDTGEVMDPEIALSLKEAANIGNSNFTEFVVSRIEKATKPLSDVIQRSNLFTFTSRPPTDLKAPTSWGLQKQTQPSSQKCLCRYNHIPMQMQMIFFQIRKSVRTSITVGSRKASVWNQV